MVKRKSQADQADVVEPRRSSRRKNAVKEDVEVVPVDTTALSSKGKKKTTGKADVKEEVKEENDGVIDGKSNGTKEEPGKPTQPTSTNPTTSSGRNYWLMKAEPETRMEKGHDVRFSIDDLASRTEPEPWDGIRNPSARNNLRAMKKGDLAFFYHSNCKVPAIVGVMEIVREHSPDLTARDPKAAYYDPRDTGEEPKWSVVHVEFRRKLKEPVTLKELREWGGNGGDLANMQILKMGRLSVSKVSEQEWEFLMGVIEEREK